MVNVPRHCWTLDHRASITFIDPLSWKKSLFLTSQILGLLVNTLAADEKYPVLFLIKTVQRYQFRYNYLKNKNFFCKLFAALKSKLNFKHFEKKMTLIAFVFPKWRTPKILLDKCLKSPVSEDPSTCNMADVPKHCWNLHHSILIIFIHLWQINWVRKSLSYWHAKSWYCLLTHWLTMKSILLLIETI